MKTIYHRKLNRSGRKSIVLVPGDTEAVHYGDTSPGGMGLHMEVTV